MNDPISRRPSPDKKKAWTAAALALAIELAARTACAAPAGASATGQDVFASSSSRAAASSARLLSGDLAANGLYRAGVEIELDPGTITYWRSPGEAGAPPIFDFSASNNVAAVDVVYPAPQRIEEQGVFVAGYDKRVIFPLTVAPRDPEAPVTLRLSLRYSACGKICLPARAELSLVLPQSGASPHDAEIGEAEKRAPLRLTSTQSDQAVSLEKSSVDRWRLVWRGQGKAKAAFVEVAEPLFVDSVPHDGAFELKLYPGGARPAPVAATVTVVTEGGAYEAPVTLR